jgi:uncharacterized protein (DUF849 family)
VLIKACLNGTRSREDHPRCPITAAELAVEGTAAVDAGAGALHVHPRDQYGQETLDGAAVAEAVDALRAAVDVPIGVTTGAWFLPDPADRLRSVAAWTVLPDFASVNFHESGAPAIAEALLDLGVGVEAGIWTPAAAEVLGDSGLADRCLRILLEPMESSAEAAIANLEVIEAVLAGVGSGVDRLLHGIDGTAWSMLEAAAQRGYDGRIGLEDTLQLPDGSTPSGNAELVAAALDRVAR